MDDKVILISEIMEPAVVSACCFSVLRVEVVGRANAKNTDSLHKRPFKIFVKNLAKNFG